MCNKTSPSLRDFFRQHVTLGKALLFFALAIVAASVGVWVGVSQSSDSDARIEREARDRAVAIKELNDARIVELRKQEVARREEIREAVVIMCEEHNRTSIAIRRILRYSTQGDPRARRTLIGLTNPPRNCQSFVNRVLPALEE